jgi:hypothetical protein
LFAKKLSIFFSSLWAWWRLCNEWISC